MTERQLDEVLEGTALLEHIGNLYEYVGMEHGKYVFQAVNDDYYFIIGYERIIGNPDYDAQY